jgi:hypothetical protein
MASRTPPPARPIPAAPPTSESAGQPVNEVAVKQAQNAVVSDIIANNDAKGISTYNLSPNAAPEDLAGAASKAKAALGLPPVINQTADKGAQGVYTLLFHVVLSCSAGIVMQVLCVLVILGRMRLGNVRCALYLLDLHSGACCDYYDRLTIVGLDLSGGCEHSFGLPVGLIPERRGAVLVLFLGRLSVLIV